MKTDVIEIHPEFPEFDKVSHCAKVIRQGGLVIFPTETVYGIAADYNNEKAMKRLRTLKGRSPDKPFSLLISQKGLISNYTRSDKTELFKLIDEYWPGPLTVIVPSYEDDHTFGIRMPHNLTALNLVQESQCSVAAPSANPEGKPPPSTCKEALKYFDGKVEVAIDGGSAQYRLASSVVDFTKKKPRLLREGPIKQEDVDRVTTMKIVLFVCTGNSCRSVMAEYLLKSMLKDRKDVRVISAGTGVYIKSSASAETLALLKKEGIDASMHESQPVNSVLLKKSDLILVMTRAHRQQILERVPVVEKRTYQLREFTHEPVSADMEMDIPDPIGKSPEAYADCMVMIKDAVKKIVKLV